MMRAFAFIPAFAVLAACVPTGPVTEEAPKGPPIEIVEAVRAADTSRIVMRYKDGTAIPTTDENRAVIRAIEIACHEGENAIPDTRTRADGLLTIKVFCVGVLETGQVIDGSGLKT
ncbi:MAG: hypothetical protein ABJN34_11635 [Litoreibacter sp.]|uniref:hypothetical protein n=1 Tax=Litoreibacter sp. TaxID=1969459 RepID=UPI00329920FB